MTSVEPGPRRRARGERDGLAEGIQEWPFGDAVLARMVVIASSVLAAVIARVVQYLLGL